MKSKSLIGNITKVNRQRINIIIVVEMTEFTFYDFREPRLNRITKRLKFSFGPGNDNG